MIFILFVVSIIVLERIVSARLAAITNPGLAAQKGVVPAEPAPVQTKKHCAESAPGLLQLSRVVDSYHSKPVSDREESVDASSVAENKSA